jgi:hypothetical protein
MRTLKSKPRPTDNNSVELGIVATTTSPFQSQFQEYDDKAVLSHKVKTTKTDQNHDNDSDDEV